MTIGDWIGVGILVFAVAVIIFVDISNALDLSLVTMKEKWLSLDSGCKKVVMTFDDFLRYYRINSKTYDLEQTWHPIRKTTSGDIVIQFTTLAEYRKYNKWVKKAEQYEALADDEALFAAEVQADIDAILKRQDATFEQEMERLREATDEVQARLDSMGSQETVEALPALQAAATEM